MRLVFRDAHALIITSLQWNRVISVPARWGISLPIAETGTCRMNYINTMFSLICAWINGWVYNHEASVSRRPCAHYNVVTMEPGHFGPRMLRDKPSYCWDRNLSDELYQYHGRSVSVWPKMRIYCFKCPISQNIHEKTPLYHRENLKFTPTLTQRSINFNMRNNLIWGWKINYSYFH